MANLATQMLLKMSLFNPFFPGDFAKKHALKLVEQFSGMVTVVL